MLYRLANPYEDDQPLIGTFGCIRMHNADVNDLVDQLSDHDLIGNDYEYIGDDMALRIMAIGNQDLNQALMRQKYLMDLFIMALFGNPSRDNADLERDRKAGHKDCLQTREGVCVAQ